MLKILLASCFVLISQSLLRANDNRPNIVLIMADDLGVECLGAYGGTSYQTPNLDKMAAEGMRFTHAYSQPLCANTRIQLMTGLYNHRNWVAFGILDPQAKTFGHYLQAAGYHTALVGKWQLQSYDPPDYPGAAERRGIGMKVSEAGFDEYSSWHTGHTELKGSRYADPTIDNNGTIRENKGKYGPDIWVNYIDRFLTKQATHQKSEQGTKPFFLYYPMALPHWPMAPTPDSPEWNDPARRDEEDTKYFKDMVEYTDKVVGQVLQSLDDNGLAENTLVLFYSDNGTHLKITSQTTTGPVKGGKGMTTDAGTHVPLIARWPGRVNPGVSSQLVDSTDILPTLLAAAKSLPNDLQIDGINFFPQLVNKSGPARKWIFCHYDPRPGWDKDQFTLHRFARTKRYKLYDDGQFYNVPKDKLEQDPLSIVTLTKKQKKIREKLQSVLDQMVTQ